MQKIIFLFARVRKKQYLCTQNQYDYSYRHIQVCRHRRNLFHLSAPTPSRADRRTAGQHCPCLLRLGSSSLARPKQSKPRTFPSSLILSARCRLDVGFSCRLFDLDKKYSPSSKPLVFSGFFYAYTPKSPCRHLEIAKKCINFAADFESTASMALAPIGPIRPISPIWPIYYLLTLITLFYYE